MIEKVSASAPKADMPTAMLTCAASPGAGAARRADRLARDHRKEAAPLSHLAYRPGDPAQPGRQERHEHICKSLELFAREVMPEFKHDPEHEAWKIAVMSGDIDLEEIDTQAFTDRYGKLALDVTPAQKAAAGG